MRSDINDLSHAQSENKFIFFHKNFSAISLKNT